MYVLVCLLQANKAVHVQAGQAGSLLSLYGGNRSNRDTIALATMAQILYSGLDEKTSTIYVYFLPFAAQCNGIISKGEF